MTTETATCRVCGGPPLCNHAGVPQFRDGLCQGCWPEHHDTASRLSPEPGALAPDVPHYRLSAVQFAYLARDLIARYEVLRAKPTATPERAQTWAVNEALDALAPFAELPPPLRRTPAGGGATLDGVLSDLPRRRFPTYAPPPGGPWYWCRLCDSYYLAADERDDHLLSVHGETAQAWAASDGWRCPEGCGVVVAAFGQLEIHRLRAHGVQPLLDRSAP